MTQPTTASPSTKAPSNAESLDEIKARDTNLANVLVDMFSTLPLRFRTDATTTRLSRNVSNLVESIVVKSFNASTANGDQAGDMIVTHRKVGKAMLTRFRPKKGQRLRILEAGNPWTDPKHVFLMPFLGILKTSNSLYMVTPHVKNGSLAEYVSRHPESDTARLLMETAGAVAFLHRLNVVHGHIRAFNVLVSDDVHALLCDSALARSNTPSAEALRSIRWKSPELSKGTFEGTPQSDVWAFGMTIHEVLSGKVPFHARPNPVAVNDEHPPQSPTHSPGGLSYAPLWEVATNCCQIDPAQRPSMDDVRDRLFRKAVRTLQLVGHTQGISSLAVSPEGATIVSGSDDRTLRLWDPETGMQRGSALTGHRRAILCVIFSSDGKTIASGSLDQTIRMWGAEDGGPKGKALVGHSGEIHCLAFSPDDSLLVSGSEDHTLRFWDPTSGVSRGEPLTGHTRPISCLAFSPGGNTIASGSWDHTLRIWNVEKGVQQGEVLKGHTNWVWCLAFSPDGKTIVSGSEDNTLRRWDASSGSQKGGTMTGHTGSVRCLAYSPDGRTVVSGSMDRTARLWDSETGAQKGVTLAGHSDFVSCLAFSPDGTVVATGSYDRSIRIWDAGTGSSKGEPFLRHTGWVTGLKFLPDGRTMVSASRDKSVRIWAIGDE